MPSKFQTHYQFGILLGWFCLGLLGLQPAAYGQATNKAISIQQTPMMQPEVQASFRKLCRLGSALWKDQELKVGLTAISQAHDVPIWLDRRIDSSQLVSLNASEPRLDLLLSKIAEATGMQLGFIESIPYLGPKDQVAMLEMAYWRTWYNYRKQLSAQSKATSATVAPPIKSQELAWDHASTPIEVIREIERQWHIEVLGVEQIPHDLWGTGTYKALSLPAQLTLVLGSFGLTAEPQEDTNQWKITPIRSVTTATLAYPANQWKEEKLRQWLGASDAEIASSGKETIVKTTVHEHYAIAIGKYAEGLPKPKSRFENQRFSFEVANTPATDVFEGIATQLQLKIEWKIPRDSLAQKRISLKVTQATVGQLIAELGKQSGVTLNIENESQLTILP